IRAGRGHPRGLAGRGAGRGGLRRPRPALGPERGGAAPARLRARDAAPDPSRLPSGLPFEAALRRRGRARPRRDPGLSRGGPPTALPGELGAGLRPVALLAAPVGLVAGAGRLPFELAQGARRRGQRVAAVALEGFADPALAEAVDACTSLQVGQLERLFSFLRAAGVRSEE